MDFSLSEEQEPFQNTVGSFVAKECPSQTVRAIVDRKRPAAPAPWQGLAEIGVAGLVIPEGAWRRGLRAPRARARRRGVASVFPAINGRRGGEANVVVRRLPMRPGGPVDL
ncbi:MAG TPA: hypothetical protein VL049_25085 [Candidatus Dormibacteraeota bacterium]|nr:hypothetical protein [Candidatus Dormibacteraeota bacterium]